MRQQAATAHGGTATALLAPVMLAACVGGTPSPEAYELANIYADNVVPKSTPARFTRAFERYCLDDTTGEIDARLRADNYVPVPRRDDARVQSWVVDDRRPAVMLLDGGAGCSVAAEARTGQAAGVRALVARRFPGATPIDPATVGADGEQAWAVPDKTGSILFNQRIGTPHTPSRLILGILRGN